MKAVIFYVTRYETHFRAVMEHKLLLSSEEKICASVKRLEQAQRRMGELDRLFIRIYEDNVAGRINDKRFSMMSRSYETEQEQLKVEIQTLQQDIEVQERQIENLEQFIQRVHKYKDLNELTPYALRELVKGVYIEAPDKSGGKRRQNIRISMAVFADGTALGTVGGGAVEYQSICTAKEVLRTRKSGTKNFCLDRNDIADIGMICGGDVVICFQFFAHDDAQIILLLKQVCTLLAQNLHVWFVLAIQDDAVSGMGIYTKANGLEFLPDVPIEEIKPLISSKGRRSAGNPYYYAEPLNRAETVYVFGGGHVSAALVPVLARVGFSVTVFEERPEFCTRERFPDATALLLGSYQHISDKLTIRPADYVVIMTRGHQGDFDALLYAMRSPATYVGVIGGRRKIAHTNQRLMENGIPESDLPRIHAPIGLPIGAETPEEIAISVTAELIQHRARHQQ